MSVNNPVQEDVICYPDPTPEETYSLPIHFSVGNFSPQGDSGHQNSTNSRKISTIVLQILHSVAHLSIRG
jgi:hypothetical protein